MMNPSPEEMMPSSPLEWALKYASNGWRVLPIWWINQGRCACGDTSCRSQGKHPIGYMVPDGLKSASNDITTITAWATQAPQMNIAIATGSASNLVVLDLDIREMGEEIVDGEYELKVWLAARGIDVPQTMIQNTGGGGSHILLEWKSPTGGLRPAIPSRANWLPGVDIRADGGYIVAAPSQHVSGKFYHWRNEHALSTISSDLIHVLANEKKQTSTTNTGNKLDTSQSLDVQQLVKDGFRLGGRDDGFTRLAGILRARGDSIDTAYLIVKQVWEKTDQNESDYFPLGTAYEKLERGYKRWDAPEELDDTVVAWAMKTDARAQVQVELGNANPALKTSKSKPMDSLTSMFDGMRTNTPGPVIPEDSPLLEDDEEDELDRDPSDPFDVGALMNGGEIEREYPTMLRRTDGKCLIYPGRLHSIYGEPGHGKTWVSLFLVRERIEAGETVAYLDYDEDDGGKSMALRLLSLGVNPDLVSQHLRYLNPQGLGRNQLAWLKLKQQLKQWQPSLVIVDTMAPALVELGLNEKDNAEVGAWYAHARWLMRGIKPQASLVIVDHVTKNGEGRGRWARGAGDKLGRLHAAYAVESTVPFSRTNDGYISLVIAKDRGGEVGREGEAAATVKFHPYDNGSRLDIKVDVPSSAPIGALSLQYENQKKVIRSRIIGEMRATNAPMSRTQLKKASGESTPAVDTVIDEMLNNGVILPTDDDNGRKITHYILNSDHIE
jgi:hypothetical protein